MNFIMFLKIIILMMSCTSSITSTNVTDTEVDVGVPIHTVVTRGTAGMLQYYYELVEPYYCMPESEWNYHGALYIEPDGTLWLSNVDNGRIESKSKKMGENIISVVDKPAELITILKSDGSVWIIPEFTDFFNINVLKSYERLKLADDNNIIDEYGFLKLADDAVMTIPGPSYFYLYIIKSDNTLWRICKWNGHIDKPYDTQHIKVMDNVSYMAATKTEKGYVTIIKTDGSLWQCGIDDESYEPKFDELEKVADDVIYTDVDENYGLFVKADGSLFYWDCDDLGSVTKKDDNVRYAKFRGGTIFAVKTDESLWRYESSMRKLKENIKAIFIDDIYILIKDNDDKIIYINYELDDTEPGYFRTLEHYNIKTPELVDITKPFNKEQ